MFNIGGIFSGIGEVAEDTVVQGRRNKHDKEQISLRDKLARERQKEQFAMSRQEKFLTRKNDRKERIRVLKALGIKDERAIASLSQSQTTTQMAADLRATLDARTNDTNELHDINDYLSTKSNVDTNFQNVIIPEFKLDEYASGDLDIELPFETSFVQKYLGKKLSSSELLDKKRETWNQKSTEYAKASSEGKLGNNELVTLEKEANMAYDDWFIHNQTLRKNQAKEDIANFAPDDVDPDAILEKVSKVNQEVVRTFNVFKSNVSKEDNPALYAILEKLTVTQMGGDFVGFEGNVSKKDKDLVYNILSKQVVEPYLASYKDADGDIKPKFAKVYPAVESYFRQFTTPQPEDVFYGRAFDDAANEIPTAKYLKFVKDRGAGKRVIIQSGPRNFSEFNITNEKIQDYTNNFNTNRFGQGFMDYGGMQVP